MNNTQRMIIAVALSALILIVYMYYQSKVMPPVQPRVESVNTNSNLEDTPPLLDVSSLQNVETSSNISGYEGKEATLENDYIIATFKNGSLTSYILKDYDEQTKTGKISSNNIDMVEQVYNNIYPFTLSFQTLSNSLVSPDTAEYKLENKMDNSVSFSTEVVLDNVPVKVIKTFAITDLPYQLKNTVSLENMGDKDLSMYYSYFLGTGIGPYRTEKNATREEATKTQYLSGGNGKSKVILEGTITKENIFSRIFGGGNGVKTNDMKYKSYSGYEKWVALNNRYFAIISSSPQSNTSFEVATFSRPMTNEYRNDFHVADLVITHNISKGATVTDDYSVYVGPKIRSLFAKDYYEESYESIFLESFLGINLRPLTYILDIILNKLYQFTKSYAWAIILFTFLFKLVTFPLTQASYKSMKKMQLVNPKIERLREQYKDNPEKLNAEIMAIYKKEKINPLGGCLPMLLPFPLLIAFFYLMQSMIELRNAPFLWITDLSSPDRLFIFPSAIPLIGGLNFNLLPILMAVTSYLSMKLQPSSSAAGGGAAAKQMKMMTFIFPLMMLFMFYNFASGLALYWTAQNVFGIAQQYITTTIEKIRGKSISEIVEEDEKKTKKKKKRK